MKYYIDAEQGLDTNTGTDVGKAWKSLEKANSVVYQPGDYIYFRRGCRWLGMFCPAGNGTKDQPVTISSFGESQERPWIDGDGAQAAIYLYRVNHWVVENIKCSNTADERFPRSGIMIMGAPLGITFDFTVKNCEITGVYGENRREMPFYRSMYWNSGIYVTFPGRCSEDNHLQDILIEGNYIHDLLTSGIRVNQDEDFINDIWHKNVVVRGNRIERTGTDGIIVANCAGPLIEFNRCFDVGALGSKTDTRLIAGIWVCATSDAVIQYNEVAGTRLFENDGTAFDTDWGTVGVTTIQYNYTHENQGGFWLDCTALNRNPGCQGTILRGNVSVNDGRCIVQSDTGIETLFEKNLFIKTGNTGFEICSQEEGKSHRYVDNIFAFSVPPLSGWKTSSYKGNAYSPSMTNSRDEAGICDDGTWLVKAGQMTDLNEKERQFGLDFSFHNR